MSTQNNDNYKYNHTNGGNIFWGVICIAAAAMVLLSAFGFLENVKISTLFFTVIFAATLIRSLVKRNITGTIFSIAFLTIVYGRQFHIKQLNAPYILLAACLLSIGLQMIFYSHRVKRQMKRCGEQFYTSTASENHTDNGSASENFFFCRNSLGGSTRYVHASSLETAEIQNSFGETTVYFDNVQLSEQGATIRVSNSFGETTLYIPSEWNIITDISCAFGNVKIPPETITANTPQVKIIGSVSFGECNILRM